MADELVKVEHCRSCDELVGVLQVQTNFLAQIQGTFRYDSELGLRIRAQLRVARAAIAKATKP